MLLYGAGVFENFQLMVGGGDTPIMKNPENAVPGNIIVICIVIMSMLCLLFIFDIDINIAS